MRLEWIVVTSSTLGAHVRKDPYSTATDKKDTVHCKEMQHQVVFAFEQFSQPSNPVLCPL